MWIEVSLDALKRIGSKAREHTILSNKKSFPTLRFIISNCQNHIGTTAYVYQSNITRIQRYVKQSISFQLQKQKTKKLKHLCNNCTSIAPFSVQA
ncbi:hypothetical protein CIPAW_06G052000 [Carya illinoinensis]|uniref:Uncharacterized protein n=1 Tax=Carya illinoinensis TaxID=32201 RepID=A0A8T1Q805_CARIL|nr:hypothetical protein CIPAW_06G052000 [Carya illinoinensis]